MKVLTVVLLILASTFSIKAMAVSEMTCDVSTQGNGSFSPPAAGNCFGFDYTFRNSTNVTFAIEPNGQTILNVIWIQGCSASNGAMLCSANLRAYKSLTARAILILPGNTFQEVTATAQYESGF